MELSRRKLGLEQLLLEEGARQLLEAYPWPGNVRELGHVIGRAALIASADVSRPEVNSSAEGPGAIKPMVRIQCCHLGDIPSSADKVSEPPLQRAASVAATADKARQLSETGSAGFDPEQGLKTATEAFQRKLIIATLTASEGNWAKSARKLKTDRANLVRLAKRLGIGVVRQVSVDPGAS
ncbi:hypothetical protein [Oceanospirillum linum]|uniref:hypothetical protein n=1 Tax=Oceanospirillum linum TaxID=966 RepID=UPI00089F4101|nr:anaerobic nitric oxide reductase transcription regulator [Oleiphilus messinensis]SMP01671.1 hypothetical protein SAMN06264348_101201 [Oceanospirillum linum]